MSGISFSSISGSLEEDVMEPTLVFCKSFFCIQADVLFAALLRGLLKDFWAAPRLAVHRPLLTVAYWIFGFTDGHMQVLCLRLCCFWGWSSLWGLGHSQGVRSWLKDLQELYLADEKQYA